MGGPTTAATTTDTMAATMARRLRRIRVSIRGSSRANTPVSIRASTKVNIPANTRVNIQASMTPAAVTGMIRARASRAIHRMTTAMQTEAAMEGRGVKHVCSAVGFSA